MKHSVRQLTIGLLALPLSLLPFWAYMTYTQEGRLVRNRALVAVNPPRLPAMSAAQVKRGDVPDYRGAVMVLAYHGIGALSDGEGGFVVPPARFGQHLVALKRAGMHAVTASQVAAAFAGGKPLPSRAVMVTFDDGRSDAIMYADPLLAQAHMKATMFVITSAASSHGVYYADWARLTRAARSGRWDLQSHSDSQHHMVGPANAQLPALTALLPGETLRGYQNRVGHDLSTADRALRAHSGKAPVAFAYPFGAYGADRTNNPGIRAVLHAEIAKHYAIAFQQDDQATVPLATPFDERTELRRLEVGDWSAAQLMQRISAAAARTAQSVAARQAALTRQADAGGELPAGVVERPGVPSHSATRSAAPGMTATSTASPATADPPPSTAVAAAPASGVTSPPATAPPSSPGGGGRSPSSPPTTSPPTTSPPTTAPPTTSPPSGSPSAPGQSGDPHGNSGGHGKGHS